MIENSNFLNGSSYRRTFFAYLLIAMVFISAILGFQYRDIHKTARENFLEESSDAFAAVERKASETVSALDQFVAQVYSNPAQIQDFYRFFDATPEQYSARRMAVPGGPEQSILDSFQDLFYSTGRSIRHIISYSRENVVDLEFPSSGDFCHRCISAQEADRICRLGCVYQVDIHKDAAYYGKLAIVLDLNSFMDAALLKTQGRGRAMVMPEGILSGGEIILPAVRLEEILSEGGFPRMVEVEGMWLYGTAHPSQYLPCTIFCAADPQVLLKPLYGKLILLALCCFLAFGAITVLLVRQFSLDTLYMTAILSSMDQAKKENFSPIGVKGYSAEYDAIASGLEELYAHLDKLIQREYKLTISQQKAEMEMLSTRLSPHFLYNTLERIRLRAMLNNDPEVAEATAGLGRLYRNIVKTDPVIPMSRELEITKEYLDLMTFLYGDQLMYYFDVDPRLQMLDTPKIWMQPIVENFFKHNFRQDDQIKVIVVELKATESGFEGRFFDNIGGIDPDQLENINAQLDSGSQEDRGIGLSNVLHRLRLYYGSGLRITMENNQPAGVCIHLVYEKEEKAEG